MIAFAQPVPFTEALAARAVRVPLATTLSAQQYRALPREILQRATISARTTNVWYLDQINGVVTDLATGKTGWATGRVQLQQALRGIGIEPNPDGAVADLGADSRLDLVLKTNTEMAQGYGQFVQANDPAVVDAAPAWEFYRLEERAQPRAWEQRWRIAAATAGDTDAARVLEETGRMIALKSSGLWQELGNGAGGYQDTLGQPYPPFAFRSGMWTRDVLREEAIQLGLLKENETARPAEVPDLNADLQLSVPTRDAALRASLLRSLGDDVTLDGDVLKVKSTGEAHDATVQPNLRPDHAPVESEADPEFRRVVAGAARDFREVRSPDAGAALDEGTARQASAEIAAVVRGVKPLYHEQWGEQLAPDLAARLRSTLPSSVEVAARDGHLYVFDPKAVRAITDADPGYYGTGSLLDRVHQVTADIPGGNGELLGYGARTMLEPGSVVVRVTDGKDHGATFWARPGFADLLARAAVRDYSEAFGHPFTYTIGGAR